MAKKKISEDIKRKNLIIMGSSAFVFVIALVTYFGFNIVNLMSNSVYETINIKERDKITLDDNYVSACTSSDSSVVTAQNIRGKCILTGISKGTTDVGLFTADDGINQKTYNVVVSSYASISKKSRWSSRNVTFRVDTNNMNNLTLKYCVSRNGECVQKNVNSGRIVGNDVIFNRIPKKYKRICLYIYDGQLINSMCAERGMFNIFW